MGKHTEGPWDFVVADNAEKPSVFVVDTNGDPLARMTHGITGRAQANAHLIAAAPEMLAALEELLSCVNVRIDDPRCAIFDKARNVVKKAHGHD